jgi:phosphopantetheinyl transferase
MPLSQTIPIPGGTAYLWKIEETEQRLLELVALNVFEKQLLAEKKHPTHRQSFLAVRALLAQVGCRAALTYDALGAPLLDNGQHISISHSQQYAALVMADHPVGIDVEAHREKIIKIAPRFLHSSECFAKSVSELTQIWTAKEALYKVLRTPGIHFADQLQIAPCRPSDKNGQAQVFFNHHKSAFSLTFINNIPNYHASIAYPKSKYSL